MTTGSQQAEAGCAKRCEGQARCAVGWPDGSCGAKEQGKAWPETPPAPPETCECPHCRGTGRDPDHPTLHCQPCEGTGLRSIAEGPVAVTGRKEETPAGIAEAIERRRLHLNRPDDARSPYCQNLDSPTHPNGTYIDMERRDLELLAKETGRLSMALGTEQTMHAAWRKRAEEAEAALRTQAAELAEARRIRSSVEDQLVLVSGRAGAAVRERDELRAIHTELQDRVWYLLSVWGGGVRYIIENAIAGLEAAVRRYPERLAPPAVPAPEEMK